MNVSMHGKAIDYIDLNPVWTQAGNPERIETGNGIALTLSATYHGDHDEFWVIESKGEQELRRFNTRGIQHIKWSAQETSPAQHDGLCNHGFRQGECLMIHCEHH